jgi:uncharacterized protein YdaU (DUF1376 family)
MARPFWFKIYAAEFLLDEKIDALPLEAQAILVRMWCLQAREGKIPADPAVLARRICVDANVLGLHIQALYSFFTKVDSHLISARLADEQKVAHKTSDERSAAAKSRWNKDKGKLGDASVDTKPMQLHKQNGSNCNAILKLELESESKTPPTPSLQRNVVESSGIPAWIPIDSWLGFVAMRQRIKKPLTGHGTKLIIGKLDRLRASGQDPGAVLDESTMNSWAGVFALRDQPKKPISIEFRPHKP